MDFQTLPTEQVSNFHKCMHAKGKIALHSEVGYLLEKNLQEETGLDYKTISDLHCRNDRLWDSRKLHVFTNRHFAEINVLFSHYDLFEVSISRVYKFYG